MFLELEENMSSSLVPQNVCGVGRGRGHTPLVKYSSRLREDWVQYEIEGPIIGTW